MSGCWSSESETPIEPRAIPASVAQPGVDQPPVVTFSLRTRPVPPTSGSSLVLPAGIRPVVLEALMQAAMQEEEEDEGHDHPRGVPDDQFQYLIHDSPISPV